MPVVKKLSQKAVSERVEAKFNKELLQKLADILAKDPKNAKRTKAQLIRQIRTRKAGQVLLIIMASSGLIYYLTLWQRVKSEYRRGMAEDNYSYLQKSLPTKQMENGEIVYDREHPDFKKYSGGMDRQKKEYDKEDAYLRGSSASLLKYAGLISSASLLGVSITTLMYLLSRDNAFIKAAKLVLKEEKMKNKKKKNKKKKKKKKKSA